MIQIFFHISPLRILVISCLKFYRYMNIIHEILVLWMKPITWTRIYCNREFIVISMCWLKCFITSHLSNGMLAPWGVIYKHYKSVNIEWVTGISSQLHGATAWSPFYYHGFTQFRQGWVIKSIIKWVWNYFSFPAGASLSLSKPDACFTQNLHPCFLSMDTDSQMPLKSNLT